MSYDKVAEILSEQQDQLKSEAILRWGAYDIENYGKMLTSFYVEPQIKNIRDGSKGSGSDIEKQILNMKKGNVILITGPAGCGKSCFLRSCFINGFRRRKKEVIAFWLSASLINEKKPRNQQSFFRNIIKSKCTSKNKVIVFIDSVDEIFNNENKDIISYLNELRDQNVCIVLGCRKNYYNRFLVDYEFIHIFEIQEWDEKQVKNYINDYLESRGNKYLFDKISKDNEAIKKFMINPFQVTLLMYLVGNGNNEKMRGITNVYSLFQTFYNEWIFKERKRNSCFIEEKDIIDVHYRIAKEFYKNFNKSVKISNVLTRRQKELECHKDEAILSLLKLREQGMVDKYIAEGFLHESFCEFFISQNLINALISGGIKIFNCFLVTYRHFELDFLEEGIANLPIGDVRKIKNNLESAYISLMPEVFTKTYCEGIDIDMNIRKKISQLTEQQVDIVRDQCLFYLGKLPNEIIRNTKIFEWAYYNDSNMLVKISAATIIINHGLDFSIEYDYVMNLLKNELWDKTLRSWVLVFWGDVIYDEPYLFEDRGGNWSRIRKRRLSRIQMENNSKNIKYMRTRSIDLAQLYIFFRNRGWDTMTEEEYNIICECNCDLDLYSSEKKSLLRYLKNLFKNAWETEQKLLEN